MQGMEKMLVDKKTVAVTDLQWGDTGKGKIVDLLASWADIVARGTGGANSGHTIVENGVTSILHLIPCGILYDAQGKVNIIGSGVAVDPRMVVEELDMLAGKKLSCNHLQISLDAKLTLPTHIVRDRLAESNEGSGKIGTTGRGIGPTFGDHVLRVGLTVNDLLNADILVEKVTANVAFAKRMMGGYNSKLVREIMLHKDLGSGLFYSTDTVFNVGAIVQRYLEFARVLRPFVKDTDSFVRANVGKRNILLEGAQGALLDVDYGTRPFVTSSNCTVDGLAKGVGLNRSQVDLSLSVAKGFYMTRVGEGPFPTELGGKESADWCRSCGRDNQPKEKEAREYPRATVNDAAEFCQGIGLRIAGNEYGAITGRPRRTGWLDLPLLRHALKFSGPDVVLTKLDVLNGCKQIQVCTHYHYVGPSHDFGAMALSQGDFLEVAIPAAEVLDWCKPVYTVFPGWKQSLKGITSFQALPENLRTILNFVVAQTGIRPRIISVGPDREETIFV